MANVIGFATEFYTLWYTVEEHTAIGKVERFFYSKNISKDLETAKALYPGVEVDETLRGRTGDFARVNGIDSEVFKFGKYAGKHVSEIIAQDFSYCLWFANKFSNSGIAKIVRASEEFITHSAKAEKVSVNSAPKTGDVIEVEFTSNASPDGLIWGILNGKRQLFTMPVVNGKAQKTKGKVMKLQVKGIVNKDIICI